MVVLSKALLYPAFAFLIGGLLLTLIPSSKRPDIDMSMNLYRRIIGTIIVLTFVPVLSVIFTVSEIFQLSFSNALIQVLTQFNIGQVWIVTVLVGFALMFALAFIKNKTVGNLIAFVLSVVMVIVISKASHSASLAPMAGWISNSIHFVFVSIWAGVLLVISLCAKDERNWLSFLKWYTPVAIASVSIVALSGMFLMKGIVFDYRNSLMLSYGQFLVVKHLLFVLIIMYGWINGFVIRRKLKIDSTFQPKKWFRLESFFILVLLMITALMTESTPPHTVTTTLEKNQPSALFEVFHGDVGPYSQVVFAGGIFSVLFGVIIVMSILLIVWQAMKNGKRLKIVISSLLFLCSSYFFIMTSVSVENTFTSEGRVFSSIEEAIMIGHQEKDLLTILQTGNRYDKIIYVLYTINDSQLLIELLLENEAGYERVWDSRLTIGGTPVKESDHKIRTFLITEGPWLQQGKTFTYVTIGFVQNPKAVASVEIRYQGETKTANVVNRSFYNLSYSDEQWEALHPIIFYDEAKVGIGDYMRGVMETDAYCH